MNKTSLLLSGVCLLFLAAPAFGQAIQPTVNRPNVQTITIPPAETAGAVQLLDDSGHVIGTSANPLNTTSSGGGGGGTVTQGTPAAASGAWPVTLAIGGALNAVGNPIFVSPGTGASFAVTGTFWQTTQPVSAASLPLPSGAMQQTGGTVQPVPGTSGGCTPYHLSGGTAASNNSTSIKSTAGNLCDIIPINTTTTIYYLKLYDSSSAPTCSSATGIKHVYPIPPASAAGGAGGFTRQVTLGESYANGIGFCVTGGGGDTDNTNAATGVFIEASYK